MATSSIKKTFTLHNENEVKCFMHMFAKASDTPPELKKFSIKMSTPEQVTKLVNAVRKMQG